MNYYLEVLKKYAVFSGRATRNEYWYFVLINLLISFGLILIGIAIGVAAGHANAGMALFDLYSLATFLPAVGVTLRRLHDAGLSGWLMLLAFVPIGNLALIVMLCQPSRPAETPALAL